VACCDKPYIGPHRLGAADPFEGLLLKQSQDLGLQRQRHIANLIEKDGPAVALLEFADTPTVGAGEGALLVSNNSLSRRFSGMAAQLSARKGAFARVLCW